MADLVGVEPVTAADLGGGAPLTTADLGGAAPLTTPDLVGATPVTIADVGGATPFTLADLGGADPRNAGLWTGAGNRATLTCACAPSATRANPGGVAFRFGADTGACRSTTTGATSPFGVRGTASEELPAVGARGVNGAAAAGVNGATAAGVNGATAAGVNGATAASSAFDECFFVDS